MTEEEEYQAWKEEKEYQLWKAQKLEAQGGESKPDVVAQQTLGQKLESEVEPIGDLLSQPELALNRREAARGATDPIRAIGRLVADPRMPEQRQEYVDQLRQGEQAFEAERAAAGREGFSPSRLMGNTVSMGGPGSLVAKAFNPTTWAGRSTVGAGTGGLYGGLTPTDVTEEDYAPTVKDQIVSGLAFGGGVTAAAQPVGKVSKAVYDWIRKLKDPWTKFGQKREGVEFVAAKMGVDKAKVLRAANEAQPGETVGDAIVRAQKRGDEVGSSIVKLEDELSKVRSGVQLRNVRASQELKREQTLDAIQKGKTVRQLEKVRSKKGTQEYRDSFDDLIEITEQVEEKGKMVTRLTTDLKGILTNPFAKKAIPAANNLAKAKGVTIRSNPVQYLHYLKGGLDKQLRLKTASGQDALTNQEKTAVKDVKAKLVKYLKDNSQKYETARLNFAERSVPVDEAKLRDELKKTLRNPSDKERPAAFLRAWQEAEKTLKRAKILVKKEFKHVLDPIDEEGVKRVYHELLDKEKYKTLTKLEGVLKDLPSEITVDPPRILWRPIVIANHALANLVKHTKPKVQKHIVTLLTDPNQFAREVRSLDATKKEDAIRILQEVLILSARDDGVVNDAADVGAAGIKAVVDSLVNRGAQ